MKKERTSDRDLTVFERMASRTERYGSLAQPDGYGRRTGECGDTIEFFLSITGGQIRMAVFQVEGCANSIACANAVSYLMEGRSLRDAWELTPENVASYLQTLPADHFHCAELAVGAYYLALTDYNRRAKEQWKNAYPRAE
jgi:nitrogen fixation NifU-like protein